MGNMTGKELQQRLSANLKELRKGKYTQETLAEATGLSPQMINNIEGCRRWPSEDTIVKIANALKIDIQQLFIPASMESEQTGFLYGAISEKVIDSVRKAVNDTLDGLRTTMR